ncbi:MAG: helix-turn-helix transcriptional regulator [Burkholderiales bacterium]|nr:MAG: helix-turn-helix transcriptional regulator [Burkholderiales bacterium]
MSTSSKSRRSSTRAPKARRRSGAEMLPIDAIARNLRGWADTVLGIAVPATDLALGLATARARTPGQKSAIARAGAVLRRMREAAGLTLEELARAVDLREPDLIANAERGLVALPFEVILRLAGVLGRGDPLTSVMKLTRAYNPDLWKALEDLGIGKLVVQAGRERELANVYRGNDAARRLSDEDFAAALAFTRQAFDMAVAFRAAAAAGRP